MPTNLNSQIQNLTGRLNAINDDSIGGAGTSGTGAPPYAGQLGARLALGTADALAMSDTSVGTLYQGEYQYVLGYGSANTTPVRGNIAYWQDPDNYVVTPDFGGGCVAGVYLSTHPSAGKYGFIQVKGIASVLFAGSITKATPAACDLVVGVTSSSKGAGDILADATNVIWSTARTIIGTAQAAPVAAAVSKVDLWTRFENN